MSSFRVLFIYPNQRSESLVPPSISLFASLLTQQGHTVDLFDSSRYDLDADDYIFPGNSTEQVLADNLLVKSFDSRAEMMRKHESATEVLIKKVQSFQPDLIAVTSTESTFFLAIHLLRAIDKYNIPTIMGGVFTTFAPDFCIKYPELDMICVGEGENALIDLCEKMRTGKDYTKVTNLWVKKSNGDVVKNPVSRPVNVSEMPMPDISLFDEERLVRPMYGRQYKMVPVETHRGCPYKCTFCNSPSQNVLYADKTDSQFFRKRDLRRVHDELVYYRDVVKAEYVFFWADTFFAYSAAEFDAFCEMYQDIKLPFWCQTRPETVTQSRIEKLQDVGLHFMAFGLEHGNEQFRAEVIERRYTNESAVKSLSIPKANGVAFSVNNIIGCPDETRELAMDTVKFNRQIDASQMSCSIFQPYQGTKLREIAVSKGYIEKDVVCPANSSDTLMTLPNFTADEMKGLRRTFAMYVKFPEERWDEIRAAESLTPEGDEKWAELREEFVGTFYSTPETDIREAGNPGIHGAGEA